MPGSPCTPVQGPRAGRRKSVRGLRHVARDRPHAARNEANEPFRVRLAKAPRHAGSARLAATMEQHFAEQRARVTKARIGDVAVMHWQRLRQCALEIAIDDAEVTLVPFVAVARRGKARDDAQVVAQWRTFGPVEL